MKLLIAATVAIMPLLGAQAQYQISGKITDENGEALPAANVYLEKSGYATATDGDGNFTLKNVDKGAHTLKVSYIGYETYAKDLQVEKDISLSIQLAESVLKGEEVIVYATRANEKTPTTFSNISNKQIEDRNMGQDLPFVLRFTPSMVVTSDAGNGVGYTGMRIRGSDPTRINVTVNGIPLNDSESHGVFWVNMPDFASSVNNIQIQRGVGTSTNGAAAFGATVNLQTDMPSQEPFARLNNGYGSFNTWRHTVEYNTGLINDHWSFEGRLSKINSDGYIDRAKSDLRSYYLAGGYYGRETTIKALTFAGKEVTYQSWGGTPESRLENDMNGMMEIIANNDYNEEQAKNLLNSGRTFNYYLYDNEVDDYQQTHYQLHLSHFFSRSFNINGALHYTHGEGFYEQYRNADSLRHYGLSDLDLGDTIIYTTDLIRRRWLDNDFYGGTFSANYSEGLGDLTVGGGYNYYDGDHSGEIIWARYASSSEIRKRYYDNFGRKSDFNVFVKANYQLAENLNLFADLQIRTIDYRTKGIDNDRRTIDTGDKYTFFNPKIGFTYFVDHNTNFYASYAGSNREPVRNDFVDAPEGKTPKPETLRNLEVGFRKQSNVYSFSANYYLMDYEDQLVLTGELNDVGSNIRVNVPDSYRTGIELVGGVEITDNLRWSANLTLSRNKINTFTEVLYDYGPNFDEFNVIENKYKDTDISFSPNVITGSQIILKPFRNFTASLFSKYVGRQYLDNTSNDDRSIHPYFINDLKLDYDLNFDLIKETTISLMVNNIFDVKYSSNGYTFGYVGGDYIVRENYYYPQAGINFLASLSLKF